MFLSEMFIENSQRFVNFANTHNLQLGLNNYDNSAVDDKYIWAKANKD